MEQKAEPLLSPNENRFVLRPIKYKDIWQHYKRHEGSFWTAEEIDMATDLKDWTKLNAGEQHFIKMVLAFFATSDGIVAENLAQRFMTEVQVPEARCFYGFQLAMENIHAETYTLLLETLVTDSDERDRLFRAAKEVASIGDKTRWAQRWIGSSSSFAERLLAFACFEGIFFSGSFCAIFWLKKRGLMPGLCFSNQLISRDEGLHCDFACLMYSKLQNKLAENRVHEIVKEATRVEKEFIMESLPVKLLDMSADAMSQYIEFVSDRLLVALGYGKLFHSKNPFAWMEPISLAGRTNFFENRVGEYHKTGVMAGLKRKASVPQGFTLDAQF
jgi:ribonucleotide reductase beta subunit family protein with ferritin-like domain